MNDGIEYTVKDSPIKERVVSATTGIGAGVGIGAYLANLLGNVIKIRGSVDIIDGELVGDITEDINFWKGETTLRQFRGEPQTFGTMEKIFYWGSTHPEVGYTAIALISLGTGIGVYKGVKKALDWYSNRKAPKVEEIEPDISDILDKIEPLDISDILDDSASGLEMEVDA